MPPAPEHLIVLMLENRSFDHMLGFLPHPDPGFDGLSGDEENVWEPCAPPARVSDSALPTVAPDPDHGHYAVMTQLTGTGDPRAPVTNGGFAWDYERVSRAAGCARGHGAGIMKCHPPQQVPVLSRLATGFAVCDRWFCAVPGATWPNRNVACATTSDGEVDIRKRPYWNRTIFEDLERGGASWRVYHDGIPQLWVFPRLWARLRRRWFRDIDRLYEDIAGDALPGLAFVEPDHFGRDSANQHPGNNAQDARDFFAAERLIASIYACLAAHPSVFRRTLFLVTYDEHGGFYDHVAPPASPDYRDDRVFVDGDYSFDFSRLGVRVPAVLVSPYIAAGTVEHAVFDHSSIAATARRLFIPGTEPLTRRERHARTFEGVARLETPREPPPLDPDIAPRIALAEEFRTRPIERLDEFQQSLLWVGQHVERAILQEEAGAPAAAERGLWWDASLPPGADLRTVAHADTYQRHVVELFRSTAE